MTENPKPVTNSVHAEYMTSSQAAKRLGLSMATIQKLVDNNILQAWKTLGGHRRIALASVLNYQNANNILDRSRLNGDRRTKVMLVIDSAELTNRLRNEIPQWGLALQVVFQESLTEALLELLNEKHDLLVIQMGGLRKPQEKNLDIVQKFMRARHSVAHTLVLTPERDLWSTNTIDTSPASIQVLQHELSPLWLSAYLSGFVALKRT